MVALALVMAWLVTLSTIEALVLEEDGGYTGLTVRVEEALEDGLTIIRSRETGTPTNACIVV